MNLSKLWEKFEGWVLDANRKYDDLPEPTRFLTFFVPTMLVLLLAPNFWALFVLAVIGAFRLFYLIQNG